MLQDTKVKHPMTVMVGSQPEVEPQFSEESLSMVHNQAYETLRAYLERTKQDSAVKLLDDLIILALREHGSASALVKDMMMSEAVGHASHHILEMGGSFAR